MILLGSSAAIGQVLDDRPGVQARAITDAELARQLAARIRDEQEQWKKAFDTAVINFESTLEGPSPSDTQPSAGAVGKVVWESVFDTIVKFFPDYAQKPLAVAKVVVKTGVAIDAEQKRANAEGQKLSRQVFVRQLRLGGPEVTIVVDDLAPLLREELARDPSLRDEYGKALAFLRSDARLLPEEVRGLALLEIYEAWLNNSYVEAAGKLQVIGNAKEIGELAGPGRLRIDVDFHTGSSRAFDVTRASVDPSTPFAEKTAMGINEALNVLGRFKFSVLDLCVYKRVCLRTDELQDIGDTEFNCGLLKPSNEVWGRPVDTKDNAHARLEHIARQGSQIPRLFEPKGD